MKSNKNVFLEKFREQSPDVVTEKLMTALTLSNGLLIPSR